MYRYARATRTLRAAATLLALHADELAVPCIKPPEALLLSFIPTPTLVWPFSLMFVPSLRLGGLARLRACQVFVLSRRRLPSAFACEQCVIDVRVAWMASRDGLPAGLPAVVVVVVVEV